MKRFFCSLKNSCCANSCYAKPCQPRDAFSLITEILHMHTLKLQKVSYITKLMYSYIFEKTPLGKDIKILFNALTLFFFFTNLILPLEVISSEIPKVAECFQLKICPGRGLSPNKIQVSTLNSFLSVLTMAPVEI